MTKIITKRSKVYITYLYRWKKYKSIPVCIKNKKGWGTFIIVSKWTLESEYVSEE